MGCRGLWRFLTKKKYKPGILFPRNQRGALGPGNMIRFDVQGSVFPTIRHAYSHCTSLKSAHTLVEKRIRQLVRNPERVVLYLDGVQCKEKQETHQQRQQGRAKAIATADEKVSSFVECIETGRRIRKQDFISINKYLNAAFCWDPDARHGLARFLGELGWNVVECITEADTQIARDCQDGDIVITGDSDALVYSTITTVWRPLADGKFLEYCMKDVLSALKIDRTQLTVLGIVSYNDYNRNIRGLGCETNYGIIKRLASKGMHNALSLACI